MWQCRRSGLFSRRGRISTVNRTRSSAASKRTLKTVCELNVTDPVEGVNEGVNEGVKFLFADIRKNSRKQTNELALLIGKSVQTVERYVKKLKDAGNVGMWQLSERLAARILAQYRFCRDMLISWRED